MAEYEPILKRALEQAARGERPLATMELLQAFARRAEQSSKEVEESWRRMCEQYPQLQDSPTLSEEFESQKKSVTKNPGESTR